MAGIKWHDLWTSYCSDLDAGELDRCDWLQSTVSWGAEGSPPVEFCDQLAGLYLAHASATHRKARGQFFTPPAIARFMAVLSAPFPSGALVVEPGAGVGILIAALAERVMRTEDCREWRVMAYENDPVLLPALKLALGYVRRWLDDQGIRFRFQVKQEDFILANVALLRPAPLLESLNDETHPQLIIANPPYFKIPKTDPRVAVLPEVVHGQPNIYALFMAAAAKLLQAEGQLIFITPRSFCSGPYFRKFRQWFFRTVALERIHLFKSRTETFARDQVLQENVILDCTKTTVQHELVQISSSRGMQDLEAALLRRIPRHEVLDLESSEAVLSVPIAETDSAVREIFDRWSDRLGSFGLHISTGPIVPFRTGALTHHGDGMEAAPVLWVQHVGRMEVTWPLYRFAKPQNIRVTPETNRLLLPNINYVLMRRFSPKEENSRITAAPYLGGSLPSQFLGIENHVNYIHRPNGSLSTVESLGLAAFLNSRWVDQYFRMSSGNTQVSATEIRNLPLPPLEKIHRIGERLQEAEAVSKVALVNKIVGEELRLPLDLSNGNGGHMPKIEEAKDLLNALGLPPAQRSELAALTLLSLANLTEPVPWKKAERRSIRIHDMILFIEQNYHKRYAENTRETFRRQVLHQFEQASIADRNPDDPTLPTNSPRTHYALSEAALLVVQNYGTRTGQRALEEFRTEHRTLLEIYQQRRTQKMIPLRAQQGMNIICHLVSTINCKWLRWKSSHRVSLMEPNFSTWETRQTRPSSWMRLL